jgi:hypothetical protein
VAILGISAVKKPWLGPFTYVLTAFIAGLINVGSFARLERQISLTVLSDVKGVLAILTTVSLLGMALQFVYARAIRPTGRAAWNAGLTPAFFVGLAMSVTIFLGTDSSMDFRISVAVWIGLATLTGLLPVGILATQLRNSKWLPICFYVIVTPVLRLFIWESLNPKSSLAEVLATLTISQSVAFLLLVFFTQRSNLVLEESIKLRHQWVPLGILGSFAVLITSGSVARVGALGNSASDYSDAALAGRSLILIVAIFAYASFPFLTSFNLFSRELGRRFREAESIAIAVTICIALLLLVEEDLLFQVLGIESEFDNSLLILSVVSWSCLAISVIPLLYYVSHNSRLGLGVAIPAAAMLIAQFVCKSALSLATTFLVCSVLLLLISLIPTLLRSKSVIRVRSETQIDFSHSSLDTVTILVPSHNSGSLGFKTVFETHQLFAAQGITAQIIAISDGSTDESVELFNSIDFSWFSHIELVENQGKGGALRAGFFESNSSVTGFIDADGDIPPAVLLPMYREMILRDADVVFGSKWHPESKVHVTTSRRMLSEFHHLIQRLLFKLDIDDTQVGAKLYRTAALKEVLPTLQETGFSLDVEAFIALAAYGHRNFVEMPVEIRRTGSSTISLRNIVLSFLDLLRIFWRARVSLNYAAIAYVSKNNVEVHE